jgi:Beta-lactamase superfamily domain
MLETTFIGHQGWQFATAKARILVDPLLVEPFGHNGGVGVVFPPRQLDITAMPAIDAVFLSHEHEDHFNVPSMNRISRDVPVYVPERSSLAMRMFLAEIGFVVRLLGAGQTIEIGDLRFTSFSPDHIRHDEQDEWDTMPFLVEDMADGGSFFSPVDVTTSAAIEAQMKQRGVTPTLWGYANNTMNLSFQEQPLKPAPTLPPIVARFVAEHKRRRPPPGAALMCGGGFSFTGPRAWMNHAFFPLNSDELFTSLQSVSPKERFVVPTPGTQVTASRDGVVSVTESAPYLRTLPRERWPDRTYAPTDITAGTVVPATGRSELRAGELVELKDRLADFAEFLYGTSLFRALYSMTSATLALGVRPRFAIKAMSGDADHVFEYDSPGCRFVLLEKPASLSDYAVGMECFASDLLDFLRCRLAPSALMFGRLLRWKNSRENTTLAIDNAIWSYGHPLRRPVQYLEFYRSIFAAEPNDPPKVRAHPRLAG